MKKTIRSLKEKKVSQLDFLILSITIAASLIFLETVKLVNEHLYKKPIREYKNYGHCVKHESLEKKKLFKE